MTDEELELEKAFLEAADIPESPESYVGYQGYKTKKKAAKAAKSKKTAKTEKAPKEKSPKKSGKKTALIIAIICLCLLLLGGAAAGGYAYFLRITEDDGLIYANVIIDGIDLGGKTPEESKTLLENQLLAKYAQDMTVTTPDGDLIITPETAGITIDIDRIVADAYNYGREGSRYEQYQARSAAALTTHELALQDYMTMDTNAVREALNGLEEQYNIPAVEPTVTINGERPDLTSKDAEPQTLTITMGQTGVSLDVEALYADILDAYADHTYRAELQTMILEPGTIDLQPIYDEYYAEPTDAEYVKNDNGTCTVKYETYGYQFDLAAVQEQVDNAEYGEVIEASFSFTEPEVLGSKLKSLLFRDALSSWDAFTPGGRENENRNTNLKLASEAIDGYVVMPGETFSYNEVVGKRTAEKGYKAATAYSGGQMVQSIGGGVCQGASALYYAALMADLEIVERRAHTYDSDYVPLGMDATVSWGSIDFKFTNNTSYPIKIVSYAYGGGFYVRLVGTNTKSYYVEMEYEIISQTEPEIKYKVYDYSSGLQDGDVLEKGHVGYKVKSYRCKYDSKTKELISREYEAASTYKTYPRTLVKIDPSTIPATPPETTAPEETTPEETTTPVETTP